MSAITFKCPECDESLEGPAELAETEIACPTCNAVIQAPPLSMMVKKAQTIPTAAPTDDISAVILKRRVTNPAGILVELVGVVLLFFVFPFGIMIGLVLLIIGGRMAKKLLCSNCRNVIDNKDVRLCPTCSARILR